MSPSADLGGDEQQLTSHPADTVGVNNAKSKNNGKCSKIMRKGVHFEYLWPLF